MHKATILWASALLGLPANMGMLCKGKDHQDLDWCGALCHAHARPHGAPEHL